MHAALLALACLLAVGVGGCGGASGDSGQTARLLSDTFGAGKPIRSGRADLTVRVDGKGLRGVRTPLAVHVAGPFQSGGRGRMPKFDFVLDLTSAGASLRAGAVSTGAKGYLRFAGHAYALPGATFARLDASRRASLAASGGSSPASLGTDPRRWLRDPRRVGEEDLGGTRTIHVAAGVDVHRLAAAVDALLARARRVGGGAVSSLARSIDRAKVDVWTGEADHALRRIAIAAAFHESATRGAGALRLDLSIAALNQPQAIGPPADPRPLSELTAALRRVLGG